MTASSSIKIQKEQNIRALDPNVLQRRAANPNSSVWVGASAGSGKTKVLTDRILRLLLPDENGVNATAPHKILALTFTKAAASEMALRIQSRLSEWATMEIEKEGDEFCAKKLKGNLKNLLGAHPTDFQIETAQKLFANVVDTPGGLKIMTIHSFCQSILGRFPLEADLIPGFESLEEAQAAIFTKTARDKVFAMAQEEKGSPLSAALYHLSANQNEDQFLEVLQNLMSERKQMRRILEKYFDADGLYTALCQKFDITAGQSVEDIYVQASNLNDLNEKNLWGACKVLSESDKKTDNERGSNIQIWLEKSITQRAADFAEYANSFLTSGNIRKKLATKNITDENPETLEILQTEAERVHQIIKNIQYNIVANLTRDLFLMGQEILKQYDDLKDQENTLDFDDLILKTLALLTGKTNKMKGLDVSPWVRYKLDQGIDHILVDEAQDTNPEQWQIIQALSDDFFDNMEENSNRSIFVVGDEKQSIFSFQRASPEKFREMKSWFSQKIERTQKNFDPIDFNISFRSVKSILELVDTIFSLPENQKGLGLDPIIHESYRRTQPGLVELWPPFENPEKEKFDPWEPPTKIVESATAATQLADYIGTRIEGWIGKEDLESYNRKIEAGDILILVRSRTGFIDQMVRALKTRNVPVSGVDRMILNDQLVVQDLCVAAQFGLLPDDDLTLATLLKSPFIGWDEEQLFKISYNRKGTLWSTLKKTKDLPLIEWLEKLIHKVGRERPYEFFSYILQTACPHNNESGLQAIKRRLSVEALDPLDEFLNSALAFEKNEAPSLQKFIHNQATNKLEIKRQMEEAGNAVRIMTVHGAKGLQAPIVIMPDTMKGLSNKSTRVLWPDRTHEPLPYFCPSADTTPPICREAKGIIKERHEEENRRLLYVALTRAENRLYIGGALSAKNIPENSWYHYVQDAFDKLPQIEEMDEANITVKRFSNPATDDKADRADKNKTRTHKINFQKPEWLHKHIPNEPFPPRPMVPSRPSDADIPSLSPLKAHDNYRFLRGNITHKLLQILPDIPSSNWKTAAKTYITQSGNQLPNNVQQEILNETLDVLNHPNFSEVFGKNSIAEVPVTGFIKGKTLISGQIDRLLVGDDEVLIVDFKTNRPPPEHEKDVPAIYKTQMQSYADLMLEIYPKKRIRAALIWTDGTRLMELKDI